MTAVELAALADVLYEFKRGILHEGADAVPCSYCSPNPVFTFRLEANDTAKKFDVYVCPGVNPEEAREPAGCTYEGVTCNGSV